MSQSDWKMPRIFCVPSGRASTFVLAKSAGCAVFSPSPHVFAITQFLQEGKRADKQVAMGVSGGKRSGLS